MAQNLSNEEIVDRLLRTDLHDLQNLTYLFEMARIIEPENHDRAMRIALAIKKRANAMAVKDARFYDLWLRDLLFLAPYDFDSYFLYVEHKRPVEKQFYLPRRHVLKVLVQDLQELEEHRYKFLGISLPPRIGKLLSDDTPVLTTDGWKKHGDLKIGDYVYGRDGEPVMVTNVFPKHVANKRVYFTDGTHIDCHENHEWVVYDRARRKEISIETKNFRKLDTGDPNQRKHRYRYQLPILPPNKGTDKELPVAPYTLGAWLGDGRNEHPDICGPEKDYAIVDSIIKDGYEIAWHTTHKDTGVKYYGFKNLRSGLQELGMCHSRKHVEKYIPDSYLSASLEQRLELLAGLLDTDGTFTPQEHRYHFSTTSEPLRDGFMALVSTFGWRCSVTAYEPKLSSSGIQGRKVVYNIGFNPTFEIPCRIERKKCREFSKQRRVAIERIEDIEPVQGNCISVEGGVYRVGERSVLTHNSTTCIFFMTWTMGRHPDKACLMSGHSDPLTKGFYKEALNIIRSEEYCWKDVFPTVPLESTSAEDEAINLGEPSRFPTLTCRSIEGTTTGAVEAANLLYTDDLIKDRKESLSISRLEAKYQDYLNKVLDRKLDNAIELMVGTRWNVADPLGKIQIQHRDDPEYRFRVIPALDEHDESNFVYKFNKGFSTSYYRNIRDTLDSNEWMAKYQGRPFKREGLIFPEDELTYYNGTLPGIEPDYVIAACDVAWGGGDSLSMPFLYVYGDTGYVHDVIFNTGDKTVTRPIVVGKILQHNAQLVRFEANNGGHEYADIVDELLRQQNYHCSISSRVAPGRNGKIARIVQWAPDIKKLYFIDDKHATQEYRKFMSELTSLVQIGTNEHDDSGDSMAQLMAFWMNGGGSCEPIERPY